MVAVPMMPAITMSMMRAITLSAMLAGVWSILTNWLVVMLELVIIPRFIDD